MYTLLILFRLQSHHVEDDHYLSPKINMPPFKKQAKEENTRKKTFFPTKPQITQELKEEEKK